MTAQLDRILNTDVDQDQRPRDVIHRVISRPVGARAFADEVEQEHVEEQEDMLSDAVPAVDINVVGGEVPDLNDCQRAEHIGDKGQGVDKAAGDVVQQGVVAPDDIDEDQVVDQLDILDFFLFFLQNLFDHVPVTAFCMR